MLVQVHKLCVLQSCVAHICRVCSGETTATVLEYQWTVTVDMCLQGHWQLVARTGA